MSEHPILFSGAMVRAILEGRKTLTRRVIKFREVPHEQDSHNVWKCWNGSPSKGNWSHQWQDGDFVIKCPYGQPGDRLWVRETWAMNEPPSGAIYRADAEAHNGFPAKWKPSIFMPRQYSRLSLEIAKIKVERVQDVTEQDAAREGVDGWIPCGCWTGLGKRVDRTMGYGAKREAPKREHFQWLWDSINAKRGFGWAANPWVWVIEFINLAAAGGNQQGQKGNL